jgi:hypothetical protein
MSQEKPLHELKNLNGRKLTRRRVMKAAVAAGMSSSAALAMTPEDVKAADSDQVTIPFDVDGETKRQMPADLLDWYYRAGDATESIKQGHAHKDAVMTIGTVGPRAGDNPHVLVTLDNSRGNAEERRGELPEKRNGVRVETKKGDETSFEEHDCDADFWDESKKDDFPDGMETSTSDSGGDRITNFSRIFDNGLNWIGWTSCATVGTVTPASFSIIPMAPNPTPTERSQT